MLRSSFGKFLPRLFFQNRFSISSESLKNAVALRLADPGLSEGSVLAETENCVVLKNEKGPLVNGAILRSQSQAVAAVLTMHERHVTAAFLDRGERRADLFKEKFQSSPDREIVTLRIREEDGSKEVPVLNLRGQRLKGGNEDGGELQRMDLLFGARKRKRERKSPREQLFSGNIPMDFSNPVIQGTMALFKGKRSTGKTTLALATGIKHLESNASKSRMCVYVSSRQNDAEKAALEVRKNCQNTKEFVCFGPASGSSEYSRILTYHAAGEYARFFSEKGKDVLLIVDGVGDLFLAQHRIQGESELPVLPRSFLNELSDQLGCGEPGEGSLTSIVIQDTDSSNLEYALLTEKWSENLIVLSNSIQDFGFKDPTFRHVLPKIGFTLPVQAAKGQPLLVRTLSQRLSAVLLQAEEQKSNFFAKKAHGIEPEPWDHYLYFDSKFYMQLLMPQKKHPLSLEQTLLLVHFVAWSVENEEVARIKAEPAELLGLLLEFSNGFRRYPDFEEKEQGTIERFLSFSLQQNSPESTESAIQNLDFFAVSFCQHLTTENLMSQFQKDYFK